MFKLNMYIDEIFKFLNTCIIKNNYHRDILYELYLIKTGRADIGHWEDPYYMRLSGYLGFADEHIMVKSIDTGEEIIFNKYVLQNHPYTLSYYKSDQSNLIELMKNNKDMIDYIRATLYPVPCSGDNPTRPPAIPIVTSDDGSISIPLTHYNMVVHRDIFNRYATSYTDNTNYKQLCVDYPYSVEYINSILWPVSQMDLSVVSENLTLLKCDEELLHHRERNEMIAHIVRWLRMVNYRWGVDIFQYEEYYQPVHEAVLWYALTLELLAFRYAQMRTDNVHPFHVWEYLQSKGLGDYRGILTDKQEMFLYKNMNYIYGNRGKASNLDILNRHLLAPFGAELRGKSILLNTENSELSCITKPDIISEKLDIDITNLQNSEDGLESIETIVHREYVSDLLPDESAKYIDKTFNKLSGSKNTYLQTKLIEIVKCDNLAEDQELHLAFIAQTLMHKLSNGFVNFRLPITIRDSNIHLDMSIGDSVALLLYCTNKIIRGELVEDDDGNTKIVFHPLVYIPKRWRVFLPYKIDFDPLPETFNCVRPGSDEAMVLNLKTYMSVGNGTYDDNGIENMIIDMYDDPIPPRDVVLATPEQLTEDIEGLYKWLATHTIQTRACGDYLQSLAYSIVYSYMTVKDVIEFDLTPGIDTYEQFFEANEILKQVFDVWDTDKTAIEKYLNLSIDIARQIFPNLSNLTSFTSLEYVKMIKLLEQLCSYNITFLKNTDTKHDKYYMPVTNTMPFGENIVEHGTVVLNESKQYNKDTVNDELIVYIDDDVIEPTDVITDTYEYSQFVDMSELTRIEDETEYNFGIDMVMYEDTYSPGTQQ